MQVNYPTTLCNANAFMWKAHLSTYSKVTRFSQHGINFMNARKTYMTSGGREATMMPTTISVEPLSACDIPNLYCK